MLPTRNAHDPGPRPAEIPRRDPGLVAIPALGIVSVVLVLVRPTLLALPLAAASILGSLSFVTCLEARSVRVSTPLLAASAAFVVLVSVARPALYLVSIIAALVAMAVRSMPKIAEGGTADSLFATFLGFALLGIAPSHLGMMAVSPFAGGESMGRALVVVTMVISAAAIVVASAVARTVDARSAGGEVVGGQLGADLAAFLAAVLVSLIASTVKRPQAAILDYLLLALGISVAVALGRRLASVFVSGGGDPEEIVVPSKIGEAYSLRIMLPASLSFMVSYYVGKLAFV